MIEKIFVVILGILIWHLLGATIQVVYCEWVLKQKDLETNMAYVKIVTFVAIVFTPLLMLENKFRTNLKELRRLYENT